MKILKRITILFITLLLSTSLPHLTVFSGNTRSLVKIKSIDAGGRHSVGLAYDGTVWAWGCNDYGQLGNDDNRDSSIPVQVKELSEVVSVACGENHTLALKKDGTVWTWGCNMNGQLGIDNLNSYSSKPVKVGGLDQIIAITGGSNHSVALRKDGTVWAWGRNAEGQLGDGIVTFQNVPVQSGIYQAIN